jgi:hypothetical protein
MRAAALRREIMDVVTLRYIILAVQRANGFSADNALFPFSFNALFLHGDS